MSGKVSLLGRTDNCQVGFRLTFAHGYRELHADELQQIRELLTRLGAVAAVEARIGQLTASALTALEQANLAPPADQRLSSLVRSVSAPAG